MGKSLPSLTIDTGEVRLAINDDPNRVISFNPNDVVFAEKFYAFEQEFLEKEDEFRAKAEAIDAETDTDRFGVPLNARDNLDFQKELFAWVREKIDSIFGEGTCQTVFGDTNNLFAFAQFLTAIAPYIQEARTEKVEKYVKPVIEQRKKIEKEKADAQKDK